MKPITDDILASRGPTQLNLSHFGYGGTCCKPAFGEPSASSQKLGGGGPKARRHFSEVPLIEISCLRVCEGDRKR